MTTAYTSLLGLALPVTGELSGTWGDTVNDYITKYLDASVAGTQTISGSQTAVTLSVTTNANLSQVGSGATGSAQYSIINCTGNPASLLTITAPAASKTYLIINATSTSQSVKIVGTGPTTGVTLIAGEKALVAWNGSDFIKVASSEVDGVSTISFGTTGLTPSTATSGAVTVAGTLATTNGGTGLTSFTANRVFYASSTSAIGQSANLTFDGTTLTANALTTTSTVTLNGGTANGVAYLNGSKVLTTGSALTFDGTNLATTGKIGAGGNPGTYTQIWSSGNVMAADGSQIGFLANSAGAPANYMTGSNTSNYLAWIANNAEAMRLTSTGLGIGTSSPQGPLDVAASGTTVNQFLTGGAGNNAVTGIFKIGSGAGRGASIQGFRGASSNIHSLDFYTYNAADVFAMRLDSSGNLGIGTSSPVAKLQIKGTGTSGQVTSSFILENGSSGTLGMDITGAAGSSYWRLLYGGGPSTGTNTLSLGMSMLLEGASAGNLGIGTSSPAAKLHVVGTSITTGAALFGNTGITNGLINSNDSLIFAIDANNDDAGDNNFFSWVKDSATGAGTQLMYLGASGNLGLGVTPSAWATITPMQIKNASYSGYANEAIMSANTYYNAGWKYIATDGASRYSQGSGAHYWFTAPSGTAGNAISFTQAMTLDASGNLGVGTTSPSTRIHAVATGGAIRMQDSAGTAKYVQMRSDSTNSHLEHIGGPGDALRINNQAAGTIEFFTSNTERARITSGGDLLVGTTTSNGKFNSLNASGDASQPAGYFHNNKNFAGIAGVRFTSGNVFNDTGHQAFYFDEAGTLRFEVRSNGGIANYQANDVNLSDQRLKTDIQPSGSYLDKICAIPVKTFLYKDQTDTERNLGVMAQDVDAVAPELIDHSGFGKAPEGESPYLAVYQTDLQYALMKCIQELKAQNDELRARVAALETK